MQFFFWVSKTCNFNINKGQYLYLEKKKKKRDIILINLLDGPSPFK